MTTEIYQDERDWEPGGIHYDGPDYTPEEDDEGYEDSDREDHDAYEAEHDYDDDYDDTDEYDEPVPRRQTYQAPPRLTTLQMPRITKPRRYIDDEF